MVRPHQRFSQEVTLTAAEVSAFASAAGDRNPLHHDVEFARSTRFGGLIASGTQTTAMLLGLTASYFSRYGAMVGLEFWVGFRRPVLVDDPMVMEWLIVDAQENPRLGGQIVDLRGRMRRLGGGTAVGAKGRVLLTDAL